MLSDVIRLLCAVSANLALVPADPARAEIEKLLRYCDGKMCAFFRAPGTISDVWTEDKKATEFFWAVMLLPSGLAFDKAPVKIYAVARYNPKKQPVSDFMPAAIADWMSRTRDAKITALFDLPRSGKPPFLRNAFEAASLDEQGYELQSVTSDNDKKGNDLIVTITLSVNLRAVLNAAEPAYLSILSKY